MTTARIAQTTTIRAGDGLLRAALMLDALVTGANGAAYLVLAGPLGDLLGLPAGFLRATGAFLAVFAAAVWLVATRPRPGRTAVAAVIAANVLWVADSLLFLALGWHDPATAGQVWIVLQAITVSLFAALQAAGARRALQ